MSIGHNRLTEFNIASQEIVPGNNHITTSKEVQDYFDARYPHFSGMGVGLLYGIDYERMKKEISNTDGTFKEGVRGSKIDWCNQLERMFKNAFVKAVQHTGQQERFEDPHSRTLDVMTYIDCFVGADASVNIPAINQERKQKFDKIEEDKIAAEARLALERSQQSIRARLGDLARSFGEFVWHRKH